MVIDNKKENTKIKSLVKDILNANKAKNLASYTQKLIKLIQPIPLNIELDTTSLFNKIDQLPDKFLYIELGFHLYSKIPNELKPDTVKKILDYTIAYQFEDSRIKVTVLKTLTMGFTSIPENHLRNIIEFFYFDFIVKEEDLTQEILLSLKTIYLNSKIPNAIVELIIDSYIIISLAIRNEKTKQLDLLPSIFQFIQLYISNTSFYKLNVIKNIIALLAYYKMLIIQHKGSNNSTDLWDYMSVCFQKDCNKTFRVLLNNILYFSDLTYSFTSVEVFNSMDEDYKEYKYNSTILKEVRAKRASKYKLFMTKHQETINTLNKERINICKGSILFIGWSLWGYKKINSINISNSVLLSQFFKGLKVIPGISFEIIGCIQRLVSKYGKSLIEEWIYIFEIIDYVVEREPEWFNENDKVAILKDIAHNINLLVINGNYYGCPLKTQNFIKKMPSNSVIDTLIKTRLLLLSTDDFSSNYESVINEHFINSKSIQIKTFIMEMIRYIYSFSFHHKLVKSKIIEDNLVKYYNEIVKSFEDYEIDLAYFSFLLTTILKLTTDINILEKLFKEIFNYRPDQDKKEKKKIYQKFQYTTLKAFYDNVNLNFQKEKAKKFNTYFFKETAFSNDQIVRFDMWLMNKLQVNENDEIFLSNTNRTQLLMINFRNLSIQEAKISLDQSSYNSLKIYHPYVVLKHNKLFSYLICQLKKEETNSSLCEEYLEFFLKSLRKVFFFQGVKLVDIINEILEKESLSKYSSRKKMVLLLEEILLNVAYHLSFDLTPEQSYDSENNSNTSILNIESFSLKSRCLLFLFKSFDSFSSKINDIIKRFRTIIQFEKYQLNSIKNKVIVDIQAFELAINEKKPQIDSHMGFYLVLNYLMKTLTTLHFYLTSITPYTAYIKNKDIVNFNDIDAKYDPKGMNRLEFIQYGSKNLSDIIRKFIDNLIANIWFCDNLQNYSIAVLHCLIGIKELLWQFGDNIVVKVIYIALIIGYPEDQNEIDTVYETRLGVKYPKTKKIDDMLFTHDKNTIDITNLKQDFISQLADIVILYYLSKVKTSNPMWLIINDIFQKKKSVKDRIMYDYSNWALTIKGDRDELSFHHRGKINEHAQIYYGNGNIITVTPIGNHSYDVIIRNSISNISNIINAKFENDFHIKNSFEVLLNEINQEKRNINCEKDIISKKSKDDFFYQPRNPNNSKYKKKRTNSLPDFNRTQGFISEKIRNDIIDANTITRILINLSTMPYSAFKQISNCNYVSNGISLLDDIPIYKTYHCGVIYFPNLYNITQYDVMSFSSSVNERYLSFLSSLGNLYDIKKNPHLSLGAMNKDGSDGSYVICYKDPFYHLIFHISNLLCSPSTNDISNLISLRKKILNQDYINIIWIENPLLECHENHFFNQTIKVFILIHPLSSTHFQISRRYNDKAKENNINKLIEPYLNNDYVINFQCKCSVDYFIQSLITINRIIDYLRRDNQNKDVCLIDNVALRMEIINSINKGKVKNNT